MSLCLADGINQIKIDCMPRRMHSPTRNFQPSWSFHSSEDARLADAVAKQLDKKAVTWTADYIRRYSPGRR